jgi:hypothetical protein
LVYFAEGAAAHVNASPLLRRALSLFGTGEMRALCVAGPDVVDLVVSLLKPKFGPVAVPDVDAAPSGSGAALESSLLGRALDGLCAVAWPEQPNQLDAAFALIERHAATITTLDCHKWSKSDAAERAVARCTHLRSLSFVDCYAPASWLQCAQLHTLHDVNLSAVSVAAMAAALPRLHTLTAVITRAVPTGALTGFFEHLLPRLRVFHFSGMWPSSREADTTAGGFVAQPLPLLQELAWNSPTSHHAEALKFIGAQPVTLDTSHEMIADWFVAADGDNITVAGAIGAGGPLACLRDLRVSGVGSSDTFDMARMLRAAPHLRALAIGGFQGSPFWHTLDGPDPHEMAPTHARVRSIVIHSAVEETRPPRVDTVARLREGRHFPRLRELTVSSRQCHYVPLTPDAARKISTA